MSNVHSGNTIFNIGRLCPSKVRGPGCQCLWRGDSAVEQRGSTERKVTREKENRSCKYEPSEHTHGISVMTKE